MKHKRITALVAALLALCVLCGCAAGAKALHGLGAAVHVLPALEHEGPQPRPGEQQRGEENTVYGRLQGPWDPRA